MAKLDLPGTYVWDEQDQVLHMALKVKLAELMVLTAPELYSPFIQIRKDGKPILYVRLLKELYRCLRSALLFYRKLKTDLENMGLKVNPYDPCVANRIVCGTQQTIVWHVDDLKLSHMIPRENTKIIHKLMNIYGKDMKVRRGKKHRYLGIDMDWSVKDQLMIDMSEYNKETVSMWPDPPEKICKDPGR